MVRREGVSAVRYLPRLRVEFPGFSADPPSEFSAVFTMHLFFSIRRKNKRDSEKTGYFVPYFKGLFIFCTSIERRLKDDCAYSHWDPGWDPYRLGNGHFIFHRKGGGRMKGLGNAPCLNCKDRHYKCHAECEPYKEFADEKRRENKERAREFSRMIYTGRTR